ncbi:hypothetical protein INR49_031686 [Caranx melampygus]|nr:hypothetical protein INR49_031686 [Caranx melampygus]
MRTMSDETEQRMCDEDFGSDEEGEEGDVESYLEDNSSELMDRLRELEAENSALMLANESQREAYERCLDEVANHVVQALLNQKDLREECIKLKMLVFDLERQNRALWKRLPHTARLPGPRGPATSMEALSPFFKKKAHILEVLRKMEETDPLKFHPSTTSLSFCDYSQVLMSTEAVLASADPSLCSPPKAASSAQSHVAAAAECHSKSRAAESKQCTKPEAHQQPAGASAPLSAPEADQSLEEVEQGRDRPESRLTAGASEELTGFCSTSHLPTSVKEISHCDLEASDGVHNGLALSSVGDGMSDDPSSLEKDGGSEQEPSSVRASASVSPSSSCLSDVKAAAINSPSKLLKFLKIPSMGEKSQAAPAAVRLSPQLTRNSRIPCRTNNYEVRVLPCHTLGPNLPPQTEDVCSQPPKDISYSSLSAPKASAASKAGASPSTSSSSPKVSHRVPHYENVCDVSRDEEPAQGHEKRTTLPSQAKANGGERKLVKSLPESVLNSGPQRKQSSSSTSESTSDDEEDSDSPVWVNHHSLPSSSALSKAQGRANYSRTREKQEADIREEVAQPPPPPPTRRSDSSSIPKRPGTGAVRAQADSSHHAFKDRLAALGKLRSSEDLQGGLRPAEAGGEGGFVEERSKTVERPVELQKEEQRHSRHTDSLDGKPKAGAAGLKYPGSAQMYEQGGKSQPPSGAASVKQELCVMKPEGSKSKIGLPSPNTDAPQVLRNNIKCPGSLNLPYNVKSGPHSSSSPNKIPPKSPSKPCQGPSVHRGGKSSDAPRYSSKSEERTKISGKGKKNPMYGDSLPPPPPRPPTSEVEKPLHPAPSPQSAIEQKVMKGIEENVLKLQEQDRGGQGGEVKQKTSNGIASWFGLKKSKLPALSRKTDATKAKDEKKEWKINIPSVGRDSVKMATRCKEGVEGLNISTLMEKAEGLRRALEEERAYVERSGRGHSCEVVMDQAQGQLAVMYRGARSDNFMQQLLNR